MFLAKCLIFVKSIHYWPILAVGGAGIGLAGAINHETVLTWVGVILAAGSAIVSGAIAGFHQLKSAVREENQKAAAAVVATARVLALTQAQFEARVERMDQRLIGIEKRLEEAMCRFPTPEGAARCTDRKEPPR